MMDAANAAIDAMKAKRLVAVCIPSTNGRICWQTMFQLREEEQLFRLLDLPWRLEPIVVEGCSLISRARSEAVEQALARGAESVMWVDDDMNWTSGAIARLLAMDVDVVGAACPRKVPEINWNVSWFEGEEPKRHEKGLIEVKTIGTGFLLVKKRVFEIMKERDPPNGENTYRKEDGQICYAYYSSPGSWGEDTYFCHRWRAIGGRMWADPAITMQHIIAPNWSVKACLGEWLDEQKAAREEAAMSLMPVAMAR